MSSNTATKGGGAIYVWHRVETLSIDGSSTISGNNAEYGGAICIRSNIETLSIDGNSTISGNRAIGNSGGAIWVDRVSFFAVKGGSVITNNSAKVYGYDAGYYLGCFSNMTAGDISLKVTVLATRTDMTPTLCATLARGAGLIVYGEQGGNQCFAGANLTLAFSLGASSSCDMACIADPTQTCGGPRAISMFLLGDVVDGLPNLALDRPAYASFSSPGSLFGPQCAVDGVTQYFGDALEGGTSYIFRASLISAPWLSVDLGVPTAIARVVIWNRCDCCSDGLQGAELRIGNVSIMSAPADTARIPENPLAWKQNAPLGLCASRVVTFSTPHVGRWVTLQNHHPGSDGVFHITELQVYGVYPGAVRRSHFAT
ncbi:hypothetical protein GPECTOR_100g12 [Gonium pectorale]|uniref:WSC domain-containing protein n=1 Tax=Gonium pectorale TaxID=33097 RepID=A0A150G1H3_GONPE|nr:hypothetical protein GPECTOR_100g12 [Gonium pectorale]|eukprot:KXZ43140.1 hypothetical protein GPECTOR_100g12 [Gonium pectorale]